MSKDTPSSIAKLTKPTLALCSNRSTKARENTFSGNPDDWFTPERLDKHNLIPVSVDFFVNWKYSPAKFVRSVWVKRILNIHPDKLRDSEHNLNENLVKNLIFNLDNESRIIEQVKFFSKHNISLDYLLFRDIDWNQNPIESIVLARFHIDKGFLKMEAKYIDMRDLEKRISKGSGGPVHIGKKGLIYGTSCLECHLSRTQYAYPGDADLILIDKIKNESIAILEFKKHNLSDPTKDQRLSNYYPKPDRRKYDRLIILRDYLKKDSLLVNLYYPTKSDNISKLEVIDGEFGSLREGKAALLKMPSIKDQLSISEYVDSTITFLLNEQHRINQ